MAETNPPELCRTVTLSPVLSIAKGNLFEIINNLLINKALAVTINQKSDHQA